MKHVKSLKQKKVLITREKSQAKEFAAIIRKYNGKTFTVPLLQIVCRKNIEQNYSGKIATFKWIFFTSAHGVHCFFKQVNDKTSLRNIKFAIVGHKTANALKNYGYIATFIPSTYNAEVMAKEFFETYPHANDILLIRGNLSRKLLVKELTNRKLNFDMLVVYDTSYYYDMKTMLLDTLVKEKLDYLTFTSPSTVRAFMEMVEGHPQLDQFLQIPAVCIGTTTEKTVKSFQFKKTLTPDVFTIDSMVNKMIEVENN